MSDSRLGLSLWAGWDALPEGASGDNVAYSFRCTYVPCDNRLDIWILRFAGGDEPDLTTEKLVAASESDGRDWFHAKPQRTLFGSSMFGVYGTAIFHTDVTEWGQVWHVSNGSDAIIARYMMKQAHPLVVADVQHIVMSVHLSTTDD
jgi:hypothetical protein